MAEWLAAQVPPGLFLCPFHVERTPSCVVRNGWYYCFGCGATGREADLPGGRMTEPMLQFFVWSHLPDGLQATSKPFCELAERVVATQSRNPERTVCLRKLLEAKDAAVRAVIYVDDGAR